MQQSTNNNSSGNSGKPPYNNNATPQQMMNQFSTPSSDPQPSQKKKKNTRNKDKARSMFNPNAPRISLESFFTGYSANSRSNVEVEFDHSVVDRVDELYCQQTQAHCDAMNQTEVQTEDKIIDTKLVNRCSLFKKLVVSTPQSSQVKIQKYVSLSQPEMQIPPSISALYDCIGKTDEDDFTIRIKDNIYTIHNIGLDIAKVFLEHSSNKWKYSIIQMDAFRALQPWKIHFGDDASTQRLRSLSKQYLDEVYDLDFEVTLQTGTTVSVSYPRLQISEDQETMVDNFVAWINKLSEEFPNIEQCITAGLLCIAQTFWFKDANIDRQIADMLPGIQENAFRMTPNELLRNIEWQRIKYQDAFENNMYMELLCDAFSHLSTVSYTNLSRIFYLYQQPFNPFGNQSQLIYHSAAQHRQRRSALSATGTFSDLRENAYGTSLTRLPQKQLASLACIFGLTTNVRYKQIYESRLNANINSVRAKFVSGDFKPIS